MPDEDRELNKRYDEIVSSLLNGLVKKGILSQEDVKMATQDQIEEFLDRIYSRKDIDFYELKKDTIRSIFASSRLREENANRSIGRPEVFEAVRNVFEKIKEKIPDIEGFLVFGSSIDPEKIARFKDNFNKSDIDIVPIGQRDGNSLVWMLLTIKLQEIAGISSLGNLIKATNIIAKGSLFKRLSGDWRKMPFWAKKPEAVYFIGSLFDKENNKTYTEQEVNELLQKQLHSTAYKSAKLAMLENIRDKILQGALNLT